MVKIAQQHGRGYSVLELIIAIAILGLLTGLLLTAIQKVREAALHTQNKNNIRQIVLGVHQLASEKDSTIKELSQSSMKGLTFAKGDRALFYRLLPYVHGRIAFHPGMSPDEIRDYIRPVVNIYRNPADPSWDHDPAFVNSRGKCSYALNMVAFDGSISLIASLPDGSSQTIAIGDKYFSKCSSNGTVAQTSNLYDHIFDPYNGEIYGDRRATFADRGWQDVTPITDPATRVTRPSIRGKTFQVRPRPEDVDPSILQTTFQAGLTVAMFDGSVRTLRPGVAPEIFWAAVTASGGETASLD